MNGKMNSYERVMAAIRGDQADRVPGNGVIMVVILEAGFITPPVGLNVFVIKGVSGGRVEHYFGGIFPFFRMHCFAHFAHNISGNRTVSSKSYEIAIGSTA
jgi:TRAP-type C4-dicarboxylate transport system permease large subunit